MDQGLLVILIKSSHTAKRVPFGAMFFCLLTVFVRKDNQVGIPMIIGRHSVFFKVVIFSDQIHFQIVMVLSCGSKSLVVVPEFGTSQYCHY